MASKLKKGTTTMQSGRPWGSNTNSGGGLMTAYNKPFTSSPVIKVTGKPARSNGVQNMKNRAKKNYSAKLNPSGKL